MCRLWLRGGRHKDPRLRRDGRVWQVQQRPLRTSGLKMGVEKVKTEAASEWSSTLSKTRAQFHTYWKQGVSLWWPGQR